MTTTYPALLLDVNGKPIPQYYNPTTNEMEPITGANGATNSSLLGSNATLIQEGTITVTSSIQANTSSIAIPSTRYRKYYLAFSNTTGQSVSSVNVVAINATIGTYTGNDVVIGAALVTYGKTTPGGTAVFDSDNGDADLFFLNVPVLAQFTLAASGSGQIDWALYGRN